MTAPESVAPAGELQEPIAHVIRRPWLLRWLAAGAVTIVVATATVLSGYTLRRVSSIEERQSAIDRRIDWLVWRTYSIAERLGLKVPEPPEPKEGAIP